MSRAVYQLVSGRWTFQYGRTPPPEFATEAEAKGLLDSYIAAGLFEPRLARFARGVA